MVNCLYDRLRGDLNLRLDKIRCPTQVSRSLSAEPSSDTDDVIDADDVIVAKVT